MILRIAGHGRPSPLVVFFVVPFTRRVADRRGGLARGDADCNSPPFFLKCALPIQTLDLVIGTKVENAGNSLPLRQEGTFLGVRSSTDVGKPRMVHARCEHREVRTLRSSHLPLGCTPTDVSHVTPTGLAYFRRGFPAMGTRCLERDGTYSISRRELALANLLVRSG